MEDIDHARLFLDNLNEFRYDLVKYVNGGCLSRLDFIASIVSKTAPFKKNAKQICLQYQRLHFREPILTDESLDVRVEVYQGENRQVQQMMSYLKEQLCTDLVGVYVHGSLGTYEEVPYSDFDALAILKDKLFESPKQLANAAIKLNRARSIMFSVDPLQHHGWFILTEADLDNYPNHYFPLGLFNNAKSLFLDKGLKLNIRPLDSPEKIREVFNQLSNAVSNIIIKRRYPKNMFQLKGFLSQFMLLPSLYVQVRDKKDVYKKNSFDLAKKDFSEDDWSIMEEVSRIRKNWFYKISPIKRWLMTRSTQILRFWARQYAPTIPYQIRRIFTDEFYQRMQKLIKLMQHNLK